MSHWCAEGLIRIALVGCVALLGSATRVAAAPFAYVPGGGLRGDLSIIDLATNQVTTTLQFPARLAGVGADPSGLRAYVTRCDDDSVSVIDAAAGSVTTAINVGRCPFAATVDPAGGRVYVSNHFDNTLSVIDADQERVLATIPAGTRCPTAMVVDPTRPRLYVASEMGMLSVIDTGTTAVVTTVPVGIIQAGLAISPGGTRLYVTDLIEDRLFVIDTRTLAVLTAVPVGPGVYGVAIHPDGTRVYVANADDNSVSVVETNTNTVTAKVPVGQAPNGVAVDPTGQYVYAVNQMSNDVSVIEATTNTVVATVQVAQSPFVIGQFIGSAAPMGTGSVPMSAGGCHLSPSGRADLGPSAFLLLLACLVRRRARNPSIQQVGTQISDLRTQPRRKPSGQRSVCSSLVSKARGLATDAR